MKINQERKVRILFHGTNGISDLKLEFELLRNAMYTDPNDQSVWMYHRWLVGTGENVGVFDKV